MCAPLLLTERDALPSTVTEFLRSDDYVRCITPLQGRDRIGILDGKIRIATGSRRVGRVEYFVAADETAPTLTLNAAQGSSKIWIEANEPLRAPDNSVTVVFRRSGIRPVSEQVTVPAGVVRFDVAAPSSFDDGLKIGDSITIASSQLRDLAGNAGRAIRRVVTRDTTAPRVSRITVTEPRAVSAASVTLNAGETQAPIESLRIIAKPGTAIDGTAGNEWTIDLDVRSRRPSSWSVTQTTSVQVSLPNQHILVVALSGPADSATIGEVADDLEALRDFNRLFTIERLGLDFETPIDTGGRKRFTGGASTVDLAVHWTEVAHECDASSIGQPRTRLIEIDADRDGATDFALDGFAFGDSDVVFVDGEPDGSDAMEVMLALLIEIAEADAKVPHEVLVRVEDSDGGKGPVRRSRVKLCGISLRAPEQLPQVRRRSPLASSPCLRDGPQQRRPGQCDRAVCAGRKSLGCRVVLLLDG